MTIPFKVLYSGTACVNFIAVYLEVYMSQLTIVSGQIRRGTRDIERNRAQLQSDMVYTKKRIIFHHGKGCKVPTIAKHLLDEEIGESERSE